MVEPAAEEQESLVVPQQVCQVAVKQDHQEQPEESQASLQRPQMVEHGVLRMPAG